MRISVILSTYNQPEWLAKTLWGYACQELQPQEIVVADDGSDEKTLAAIEAARRETGLKINRVWHQDDGFRKTVILNRAVESAEGEYLVFSDGDCIPRGDFLATHRRHALVGQFLSSGAVRLPLATSREITKNDIVGGQCFDAGWIAKQGGVPGLQRLKLLKNGWRAMLLDRLTPTKATWNGNNASCWKSDALRVGGFDERMQYGGEDREFGERLLNLGLEPKQLRYRAVLLHLDHDRGYVEPDMMLRNRVIRNATRTTRRVRTEHGIRNAA